MLLHDLVPADLGFTDLCVYTFRQIGSTVPSLSDKAGDRLRILQITLLRTVVIQLFTFLHTVWVDRHKKDIPVSEKLLECQPVASSGFAANNDLGLFCLLHHLFDPANKCEKSNLCIIKPECPFAEFVSSPVKASGKVCFRSDIYTYN